MKKLKFYLLVFVLTVALGVSSCAAPATQLATSPAKSEPTATPDPAENPQAKIVLDMVAKLNAGDVDGSLAYFSEDAMSYFIGMPPTGMEVYQGAEGLRPTWEYAAGDNFRWEVQIESVRDNIVTANTKTYLGFTEDLGVAPNDFVEYFLVENDKIKEYASVMTEESLAEFKPALLAVMPLEPPPAPTSEPVSELTVTFADNTCKTPGLVPLKSGQLMVNTIVQDTNREKYAVALFTLSEGKDLIDLMASTQRSSPPEWSKAILMKELDPGESQTYNVNLKEGPVYLICFAYPFEMPIGNAGPFEVKP